MNIASRGKSSKEAEKPQGPVLSNGGGLDLTFVGAGSAFSKKYYQNNILIVKGTVHVLVDCGSRAPQSLALLGIGSSQIDRFLITHTHADHIGGLEEIMLTNRFMSHRKPKIIITDKLRKILWDQSLRGGASWNAVIDGHPLGFDDFWVQEKPLAVKGADREYSVWKEGGLEIGLYRTKHIPDSSAGWKDSFPSYGLLVDGKVLYTSDTRFDRDLVLGMDEAYGLETIFHDCQFYTGGVHASLEELSHLPAKIKAKTWLMHYGDGMEEKRSTIKDLGFAGIAEEWATYSFD
jgi:ribonuclease BN (tRNA processing enzyme)